MDGTWKYDDTFMISSGDRLLSGSSTTIPAWEYKIPENGSNDSALMEDFRNSTNLFVPIMNWLAENVVGSIPKKEELKEHAVPVIDQQGSIR